MKPGVYRARALHEVGGRLYVHIPQVYGDVAIPVTEFTATRPTPPTFGWVAFQGGDDEHPVWLSGVDESALSTAINANAADIVDLQAEDVSLDGRITSNSVGVTTLQGKVLPAGGSAGQHLTKTTATDYDAEWSDTTQWGPWTELNDANAYNTNWQSNALVTPRYRVGDDQVQVAGYVQTLATRSGEVRIVTLPAEAHPLVPHWFLCRSSSSTDSAMVGIQINASGELRIKTNGIFTNMAINDNVYLDFTYPL